MQGGKELPTLHSRESLRHAPGMPSPSTPFEGLGCSPLQARVHWKLVFSIPSSTPSLETPLCFCRRET